VITFRAELAGIPFEVRCRHEESRAFMRDYLTEKPPVFQIEPAEPDLEKIRVNYERLNAGEDAPEPTESFLERCAIHDLLATALAGHDVLLVHASALALDGEAVLFTAPSGTGKSTHAALWRRVYGDRVVMINDDKPLISLRGGVITACGSPWSGKHHLNMRAAYPLRAVAEIRRASGNRIEAASKAEAFDLLLRQAYRPDDPEGLKRVLELDRQLTERIPFYRLYCNMEPEAAVIARESLLGK